MLTTQEQNIINIHEQTLQELLTNFSIEGYAKNWSHWEVIREIISNAIDEANMDFKVYKAGMDLIIEDGGKGIDVISLIMGESHKDNINKAIGQFGEGLKLAMLVLTRENKLCEIFSRKLYVRNAFSELKGIKLLKFEYYESDTELFEGTKIIIHDWQDELFTDRFLATSGDNITICDENKFGKILQENKLFNKGVFLTDLPNNAFGYDLNIEGVNRDRNVIDDWTLQYSIGDIWGHCENQEGWQCFFDAVKDGKKERDIRFNSISDTAKLAMELGFDSSFGKNTVIKTNEDMAYEARHRKANVIEKAMFGNSLFSVIELFTKTDFEYVIAKKGIKFLDVSLSKLTEIQRRNYSICKRLAKKFNFNPKNLIVANLLNEADGLSDGTLIKIHPDALNSTTRTLSVMIHELAHHIYGTRDNTDAHVKACTDIGAKIFMLENNIKDETVIMI